MAARVNLSIPDDLKERMDKVTNTNWSGIAQDSFETFLTIHELKEKNMNTEAGVARLRASKKTNTERQHAEGIALGNDWALKSAEYDELEAVAKLANEEPSARGLASAMGYDDIYSDFLEFFGDEEPSDAMIEGFIQGAVEVFKKV